MPSVAALFIGFLSIGISGFGGVLPWARRMVVEQRRWMTPDEFIDAVAMCQFLPGPNIVNFAVALGGRFQGPMGALAGVAGLLLAPMAMVIGLGLLLEQVADNPIVVGALRGLAAAACGLVVSMAVKIAAPLVRRRDVRAIGMAMLAFAAVAVLRLPLVASLVVLAPMAILLERLRSR